MQQVVRKITKTAHDNFLIAARLLIMLSIAAVVISIALSPLFIVVKFVPTELKYFIPSSVLAIFATIAIFFIEVGLFKALYKIIDEEVL